MAQRNASQCVQFSTPPILPIAELLRVINFHQRYEWYMCTREKRKGNNVLSTFRSPISQVHKEVSSLITEKILTKWLPNLYLYKKNFQGHYILQTSVLNLLFIDLVNTGVTGAGGGKELCIL